MQKNKIFTPALTTTQSNKKRFLFQQSSSRTGSHSSDVNNSSSTNIMCWRILPGPVLPQVREDQDSEDTASKNNKKTSEEQRSIRHIHGMFHMIFRFRTFIWFSSVTTHRVTNRHRRECHLLIVHMFPHSGHFYMAE